MKDAYFFSHDSNARNDPKIMALINVYGMEGYGRWWVLVEMLREQTDYKLKLRQWSTNALAMAMLWEANSVEKFIHDCVNEFELLESDGDYVWSNSLLRRMSVLDDRRKKRSEAGKKGAKKRWSDSKAIAKPKHSHSKAIAKDGKVKESTVQKSTRTPPVAPPKAEEKKKSDGGDNVNESLKKIYDAFSENIHPITPFEAEGLAEWVDDGMEPDVIVWAIRQAVLQGKRTAKYIDAIIRNLHTDNITTVAGAEARERNRQQSARDKPGAPRAREPTKPSPEEKKKLKELTRLLTEKQDLDAALDEKPEEEVPPWEQEPPRKRA